MVPFDPIIVDIPTKEGVLKNSSHSTTELKNLVERIVSLFNDNKALSVSYNSITPANLSTMHLKAYNMGYKLHCWHINDRRVFWAERKP